MLLPSSLSPLVTTCLFSISVSLLLFFLFTNLLYLLDSTYKWYQNVFIHFITCPEGYFTHSFLSSNSIPTLLSTSLGSHQSRTSPDFPFHNYSHANICVHTLGHLLWHRDYSCPYFNANACISELCITLSSIQELHSKNPRLLCCHYFQLSWFITPAFKHTGISSILEIKSLDLTSPSTTMPFLYSPL